MRRTKFKSRSPWNTNNTRYDKKLDKLFGLLECVEISNYWRLYSYVTDRVGEFFSETSYGDHEEYTAESHRESILTAFDQ